MEKNVVFTPDLKSVVKALELCAEALGVVDDRLPFLKYCEVLDGLGETGCKIYITVRIPASHNLASYNRIFIQKTH